MWEMSSASKGAYSRYSLEKPAEAVLIGPDVLSVCSNPCEIVTSNYVTLACHDGFCTSRCLDHKNKMSCSFVLSFKHSVNSYTFFLPCAWCGCDGMRVSNPALMLKGPTVRCS